MYTQTLTQTHTQTHTIKSTRTSTLTFTRTRARTAQAEGETEGFLGLQCPCGDGVAVFESVGPQEHYKSCGKGGSNGKATHVTLPGVVGAITAQGGGWTNAVYRLSLNGGLRVTQADGGQGLAPPGQPLPQGAVSAYLLDGCWLAWGTCFICFPVLGAIICHAPKSENHYHACGFVGLLPVTSTHWQVSW